MPKVAVNILKCIQDSQEYGSNDDHMVSRVFCRISVDGRKIGDFYSDIKQTVGADYGADSIEVIPPHDYKGHYNHQAYSEGVRAYFLRAFNRSGAEFSFGNSTNVRMRNNTCTTPHQFEFEADQPSGW
jgi:hypothetical protein